MLAERVRQMSVEEYLAYEESSEEWHEYIDGELYPMTGGTVNHFRIIKKIMFALETSLAEADCEVLAMRVKVSDAQFLIPDLSVVCGDLQTEDNDRLLLNPALVIEVTSPSSIDFDRGSKRELYDAVASVQAYLVVDQHRAQVELYSRSESGWHLQTYSDLEASVPLEALNCSLHMREIYRDIQFET